MNYDPLITKLLADIESFREKHDINPTQFGLRAVNNGDFIRATRMGRVPSLQTIAKVRRFMRTYKRRAA